MSNLSQTAQNWIALCIVLGVVGLVVLGWVFRGWLFEKLAQFIAPHVDDDYDDYWS